MPPPFDQNANEARKASGRRLFSERRGDNHENPDRDLLETAIIVTVVLGAAIVSSFGWRMVSHVLSGPTHAAQHKMERTDIEAPHHVPQHADRPMTRAGWIEDRSIFGKRRPVSWCESHGRVTCAAPENTSANGEIAAILTANAL
jgi:hypothetical protein